MKIVISGGTGLIGQRCISHLAQDDNQVIVLSRSPESAPPFPSSVSVVLWDGKTTGDWISRLDGASVIINLAGASIAGKGFFPSRWTQNRREIIRQSRIQVGNAITEGIRSIQNKPDLLIQASAIGYYGTSAGEKISESAPPGSDFVADTCQAWEASTSEVENMGVRRVVTRFGIVLSTRGGALPRLLLPFRLFLGGPMGNGKQWYSWVHIDDVCQAFQFLINNQNLSGAFNITAPDPVQNRTFAALLGKTLNRPSWVPVPGFMMRLIFGDVASVVLEGQRVIPRKLHESGFSFKFPDLENTLKHLLDSP